jgi:hypothetical protein
VVGHQKEMVPHWRPTLIRERFAIDVPTAGGHMFIISVHNNQHNYYFF